MELGLARQEPEPIPTGTGTGQTCTTMAGVHGAEVSTRQKGTTGQVWSLTQFYSVDFSQSRIGVKKCVFNKRTIKVCVSGC